MNILYDMLDHGKEGNYPSKIVIHAMSELFWVNGETLTARNFLNSIGLSAHALIHPDGDITICRSIDQTAYHARSHNHNSLGIEFLVPGLNDYSEFVNAIKSDWVSPAQYDSGVELVKEYIHDAGPQLLIRHSDLDPARKVDPGAGFKWTDFKNRCT